MFISFFQKNIMNKIFLFQKNNFSAYKLIESWPAWPGKWLNILRLRIWKNSSGKNFRKKIKSVEILKAKNINNEIMKDLEIKDCIIIDNFENNIDEKLFYSILNQSKQLDKHILINSFEPINKMNFQLADLQSRVNSFLFIGIELPNDDLLKVIISKTLSDKQISINPKILDYILNNVERSYEKMFKFLKELDELSLSTGKSININLIKKVLNQ